jgi:hypothetical protein
MGLSYFSYSGYYSNYFIYISRKVNDMLFNIPIDEDCKWIAQDKDGDWCGYDTKPKPILAYAHWNNMDGYCMRLCKGYPPKDWKQELYEVINK